MGGKIKMRTKKFLLSLTIVLALSMLLAACGGEKGKKSSSTDEKKSEAPSQLSILTGGTGGTYYPLGGEIGNIITSETDIDTTPQSSGASVENMTTLEDGGGDIAFTQTDIASYASEGAEMFDGDKIENIQGIGTLYPETVQIVSLSNSGIKSVEDLKGKTVSVGAPGSGTYANAEQILEIHGITMKDIKAQHLSFDESTEGIQDGSIDAAFITAGTPTGAVEGLQATKDVTIIPIADDKIKELQEKYPFYIEDTVKEGTYGLKEDTKTVAVMAMLAVRADIDEDTVYNVTKALFENVDKITNAKGKLIKVENALQGLDLELHPGAAKYFEEKGVSKEE